MKTKTIWYQYLPELQKDHPELTDEQLYDIDNFRIVTINDKRFGKDNIRINKPYFVEVPTKYGFDEDRVNIYDDLISDDIRKYIPNHTIRAIRDARFDGSDGAGGYQVNFDYLPLRQKNIKNPIFDQVFIKILKIGDWLIFKDGRYVADLGTENTRATAKKYNVYEQSLWEVAEFLRYNEYILTEAKRQAKDLDKAIRKVIANFRAKIQQRLLNGDYDEEAIGESKEELDDMIIATYLLLKEQIEIDIVYEYEQWKTNGYQSFETKDKAYDFIELVNEQDIQKPLAESLLKNPFSKFGHGGNIADQNYHMALSDGNTIKHHSEELNSALRKNKQIPAWVVAKLHQASTTLSDITHYLDMPEKYGRGGYSRPAPTLNTTGTYQFETPKGTYIVKSYLFERQNEIEDSLEIQDELRTTLGSIIIKNSAWKNLSSGKTVRARSSKNNLKGTLKKLKNLGLGGTTGMEECQLGEKLKHKYSDDTFELVAISEDGYTVAKIVNGKRVEFNTYPEVIFQLYFKE